MTPAPRRRRARASEPQDGAELHDGAEPTAGADPQDGRRRRADGAELERDPESFARAIALRQLTGAPRSRHQLAEAMARRGVEDAVAERVLDRFTEVGLIDDAEYARMLVRSQRESRGLARRALAMELRRKGIAVEHAEPALATVDDEAEEATARDLLRRRWRSGPGVDPHAEARRAMGMLARKGYPPGLSSRLVREMRDDRAPDPWETPDADPTET